MAQIKGSEKQRQLRVFVKQRQPKSGNCFEREKAHHSFVHVKKRITTPSHSFLEKLPNAYKTRVKRYTKVQTDGFLSHNRDSALCLKHIREKKMYRFPEKERGWFPAKL
jgi:hypothetical protein